ncbi:uncharacterized protein K441DRAFT_743476 [Cenococcum geophilum 1.58]|uniref:uncharacterized protein n=1 Tax=Cenococcum geophilum 1.58 TaxID=794803 RepID=UPI00358F0210|nr:hypothetical protein K441DRAFT_743476 [Cenococcum geophilum 1.58]
MVGGFFIPVCLFWFSWSARPSIHWIMPIIGSGYFPSLLSCSSILSSVTSPTPIRTMLPQYSPATTSCAAHSARGFRSLRLRCTKIWA